jgi:hypothetical protein
MKKLTILILLTLTFFIVHAEHVYQQEQASEKLVLNNGAKWKVDKTTRDNVAALLQIVKTEDVKTVKMLKDYKRAGIALQNGITKMLRECRVKGPDHHALHQWIEPLIDHVNRINQATNAASAGKLFKTIHNRLNQFYLYFQV